mmetsp:Transcript_9066/g.17091  ORF Transcript_9066/g.17091 Transcript_9066/m.17091 type:complete len:339 (-) Transcript_9066:174-1190(-)
MSLIMQSIRRKVTNVPDSNSLLLKTFLITSVTTLVGAFSFLKSSEQPRSSLKFLKYNHYGPPKIQSHSPIISSHSQLTRIVSAMVTPNKTTFCNGCHSEGVPSTPTTMRTQDDRANTDTTKYNDNHVGQEDDSTYYYEKMKDPPRNLVDGHAIFGALLKPGYIERYDTYRRVTLVKDGPLPFDKSYVADDTTTTSNDGSKEVCVADVRIGESLNGHVGIVHGGIISLILDDTLGWGCEAMRLSSIDNSEMQDDFSLVVTANLTVNYRKPLPAGSNFVVRVRHEKTEGRKIYFTARIESYDGETLYAEASSLFLKVKMDQISTKTIKPIVSKGERESKD